jgi:hypothetical protein
MRTKIVMFMIGLFALIMNTTNAQVGDQTSIGPRVGINFSNVSNVDDSETLTGLVLGLTSTYSISEVSGITVDLLYSQEGFELDGSEYRLNYLNLPVYYDLFFGELGEAFRPKVYVGLVPGFLINAKINGTEFDELYNSFNVSLSGGLGFNLRMGNKIWLNTDLRAYLGLTEIREESAGDKVANSNVQLSLGLAYGLSKY